MNARLFQKFCEIAYSRAGIKLHGGKEALVAARVAKRLRVLGLSDPAEYLKILESDASGNEVVSFLDVISTNFTAFFREVTHFDRLHEFLDLCLKRQQGRIRIWCTASSSGEEPYTIAMTAAQVLDGTGVDWRILATDISTKSLALAERGIYEETALGAVPRALAAKYFTKLPRDPSPPQQWRICEELRHRVVFRRLNLAQPPYPMSGPIDVVFCRNVMIYFDQPVRQGLVSEIERLISDDGLVCVGHSESLSGLGTRLAIVEPSVYQPRGTACPLASGKSNKRERI